MPTSASHSSPDRFPHPLRRHQVDDARPNTTPWSFPTRRIGLNGGPATIGKPKSDADPVRSPDSLPHEKSPLSRERSGLAIPRDLDLELVQLRNQARELQRAEAAASDRKLASK
jgi:hypothetical protein